VDCAYHGGVTTAIPPGIAAPDAPKGAPKAPRVQKSKGPYANKIRHPLVSPKDVWVPTKTAQAILGVTGAHLWSLKREGKLSAREREEYNLAEILERYRQLLKKTGELAQEIEAICIREFAAGKLPAEVIIEHGYAYDIVKQAWDHHIEMRKDPEIARIEAEREASSKKQEVVRCRECLRSSVVALDDTHRIVREATGDPERTAFNINEDRVLVGLDIRCPSCRMLKATAPIESIRARLRVLAITGLPKPVDVDREMPLPSASVEKK
jgi:hypothetical protein